MRTKHPHVQKVTRRRGIRVYEEYRYAIKVQIDGEWVWIRFKLRTSDWLREANERDKAVILTGLPWLENIDPEWHVHQATLASKKDALTYKQFIDETYRPAYMSAHTKATRDSREMSFRLYLLPKFGGRPIAEVADDVAGAREVGQAFLDKGCTPRNTLDAHFSVIRAWSENHADDPPRVLLHQKRIRHDLVPTQRKLGPEEVWTVENFWKVETITRPGQPRRRLRWAVQALAMALLLGARNSEIRALRVEDVDQQAGVIHVTKQIIDMKDEHGNTTFVEKPPKKKTKSIRDVVIFPDLLPFLQEAMRGKTPKARLILNEWGQTPLRENLLAAVRGLCKAAKVPVLGLHAGRHRFITEIATQVGVPAAMLLAGHSTLASSLSVVTKYTHPDATHLEGITSKVKFGGQS